MEDSKRRRPSFPANYLTLVQLQQRWIKEQQRKQNKVQQQLEPEPRPQEQEGIGDVLEKSEVDVCLASCETADKKIETEESEISKWKWVLKKSKNSKSESSAWGATGAAEDVDGGEARAPHAKEARVEARNRGRLGKMSTDGGREKEPETKPEVDVCLVASCETADKKIETEESEISERKWVRKMSKNSKSESSSRGATGATEDVSGGEAHAPQTKEARVEARNRGGLGKMSTDGGRGREKGPETKPEVDVSHAGCETADKKIETEESEISKRERGRKKSKNSKSESSAWGATGAAEDVAGGEAAPQTKEARVEARNRGRLGEMSTDGGRGREKVPETKPEVDVCLASCKTADKKIESEESEISKRKWVWKKSKNSKSESSARGATGAAEDVAGGEAHAPQTKEARVEARNQGRLGKMSTDGGRGREKGPETKPEVDVSLAGCETADKKIETEESEITKRERGRKKSKNSNSESSAWGATGAAEDVAGGEAHAPQTKEARVESRNRGRLGKMSTDGGRGREKGPETKPEVDVCLASGETVDKKIETEESEISKRKWVRKKSKNSKSESSARGATGAAEDVAGGEAHAPQTKEASVEARNRGRLRKMTTDGGRGGEKGPETKPEGAVCLVSCRITHKGETWKSTKNQGKGEWKKVKEKIGEEEVAVGEVHTQKTSDEKEERAKSGNAVVPDRTVEIEGRLKDMSFRGRRERWNDAPARPNHGGHYRGGSRWFDNSGHRLEEMKCRNEGMIWVKKGDISGGSADDVGAPFAS